VTFGGNTFTALLFPRWFGVNDRTPSSETPVVTGVRVQQFAISVRAGRHADAAMNHTPFAASSMPYPNFKVKNYT
jgi:hypothetical protein